MNLSPYFTDKLTGMTNTERNRFVIDEWKELTNEERAGIEEEAERINDGKYDELSPEEKTSLVKKFKKKLINEASINLLSPS